MMKKDWTIKKLGELVTTINGLWKGKKPPFVNVAVIRNTNFSKDCQLKLDDVEYLDVEEKQFKTRQLHMGDIIIEKSGGSEKQPVGRPILFNIQDDNYSFSNFTSTLRINNQKEICSTFLQQYLYHRWLEGDTKSLQSHTTGIHNLDFKGFLNFDIPVPPLEEQKRIVAVLDKKFAQIETLKTAAEKNLQNTKQLFQAELEKAFSKTSWKEMSLQDVCTKKITDGTHQTPKYCTKEEGGIPFISSKDVTKEYIDWTNIKYIVPELHEVLYKRIAPQKDDILLAKNGTTGIGAIVEDDKIFDIYVTLAVLRPNVELVKPRYLLTVVNSPLCKRQFNAHLKGSGVPNLHLEEIQKVIIPVPSLKEQEEIIKKVESLKSKVHQLEGIYTKQLADCDELKQSLLQKAFEGEL